MKNIIYGLGTYLTRHLSLWTDILKDTVAFSDSNEVIRKKYTDTILGRPVIAPDQIPSMIDDLGGGVIYVASGYYYREIFDSLTKEYKIPHAQIAYLRLPNSELLTEINNFAYGFCLGPDVMIDEEYLSGARVLVNRESALDYVPQDSVCTEIGVAYGDFSRLILDKIKPSKFYAVDLFQEELSNYFERDEFIKIGTTHKEWYEKRFEKEIKSGILETRQGLSWDEIAKFPDNYLDFAYLDAAHDYESVIKDLAVLPQKVKNGGIIQFNDYTPGDIAARNYYGVISAVNRFVNNGRHKVIYLCLQSRGYHDMVVRLNKE